MENSVPPSGIRLLRYAYSLLLLLLACKELARFSEKGVQTGLWDPVPFKVKSVFLCVARNDHKLSI